MSGEVVTHPCRWCGQQVYTVERWPAAKWVVFLAGLLLTPVCVGLVLAFGALFMANERYVACAACGRQ